jgi:hypothetical protein
MRTFVFLSTDDLIEQLVNASNDVECDDIEYYRGIYSESMDEIKKYHTDYLYIVHTKRFGCWMI